MALDSNTPSSSTIIDKYLEGLDFPARHKEMLRQAHVNDAPDEVIDRLQNISDGTYEDRDEVVKALDGSS